MVSSGRSPAAMAASRNGAAARAVASMPGATRRSVAAAAWLAGAPARYFERGTFDPADVAAAALGAALAAALLWHVRPQEENVDAP